jgi:hypothetical protein
MSSVPCITPAPVGQQGPPTRVAAFDSWRSLRDAREPLLLATGTALPRERGQARAPKICANWGKLDTHTGHVNP